MHKMVSPTHTHTHTSNQSTLCRRLHHLCRAVRMPTYTYSQKVPLCTHKQLWLAKATWFSSPITRMLKSNPVSNTTILARHFLVFLSGIRTLWWWCCLTYSFAFSPYCKLHRSRCAGHKKSITQRQVLEFGWERNSPGRSLSLTTKNPLAAIAADADVGEFSQYIIK